MMLVHVPVAAVFAVSDLERGLDLHGSTPD